MPQGDDRTGGKGMIGKLYYKGMDIESLTKEELLEVIKELYDTHCILHQLVDRIFKITEGGN